MAETSTYNSSHRAFAQAFFSRGILTFDEAKPILAAILTAHDGRPTLQNDITTDTFTTYIQTLNNALSPFDYEIRSMHAQSARSRSLETAIYALVNATSDPQTQLATTHSPNEIAFVKRVLDGIFDGNNSVAREVMAIRRSEAMKLRIPRGEDSQVTTGDGGGETPGTQAVGSAGVMKVKEAEEVLISLVEEGWFEESERGFLSLSPRALMELKGWLMDVYNDVGGEVEEDEAVADGWQRIKTCHGCKQIITEGQRCSRQACLCRFHEFCVTTFFRGQQSRKCPLCETEWRADSFVGERAAARNPDADRRSTVGSRRG